MNKRKMVTCIVTSLFSLMVLIIVAGQAQAQDTGTSITGYVCEATYNPQYKLLSIRLSSQTYCGGTLYNAKSAYTQAAPLQNTASTFYYTEEALMSLQDQVTSHMRSNRIITINYLSSYPSQISSVKFLADTTP